MSFTLSLFTITLFTSTQAHSDSIPYQVYIYPYLLDSKYCALFIIPSNWFFEAFSISNLILAKSSRSSIIPLTLTESGDLTFNRDLLLSQYLIILILFRDTKRLLIQLSSKNDICWMRSIFVSLPITLYLIRVLHTITKYQKKKA